jgi:hypothetical protein
LGGGGAEDWKREICDPIILFTEESMPHAYPTAAVLAAVTVLVAEDGFSELFN